MKKNYICKILVLSLLISQIGSVQSVSFANETSKFSDIENSWAKKDLIRCVENNLLQGNDGKLNPNAYLTKAEMASIITRAFGATALANIEQYKDVNENNWFYDSVAKAVNMGVLKGNGENISPNKVISREEVVVILDRALDLESSDVKVLDKFKDGENISSWAKGSIANFVARGYLSGDDEGKINAKKGMTRAEFASLMTRLVERYVVDKKEITGEIKGNILVRVPEASIKNATIKGNLIIGDGVGVGDVMLDNVNIEGKLIVRGGGEDSITIKNSTLQNSAVLTNPNGRTRFNIVDCQVGSVDAKTDIIVDGNVGSLIVHNNANANIRSGNVDTLLVKGDSKVNIATVAKVKQAKVEGNSAKIETNGKGLNIIKTGVKPNNSNSGNSSTGNSGSGNSSGGGSSTGNSGSGNSGGGNSHGNAGNGGSTSDKISAVDTIFVENSVKLVNVEQVHFATLELENGNLDDYIFTFNGVNVKPTAVNDQKTIIKLAINPKETGKLKATKDKQYQEISVSKGVQAFTKMVNEDIPEKILTNGKVNVFDFYLSNYDSNGNIRVNPSKLTFDTEKEGVVNPNLDVPKLYAPQVLMSEDTIIKYNLNDEKSIKWNENIYAVFVDFGRGEGARIPVEFSFKETTGAYGKVGQLILHKNSEQFQGRNGIFSIIIQSKDFPNAKIDVVRNKQSEGLTLDSNFNWNAHQDLLFEMKGLSYIYPCPVYSVELDGKALAGDCVNYHIVDNLIRLENDTIPLLTAGNHTLTIKAWGYTDYTKTFNLETAENGSQNPVWGEKSDEKMGKSVNEKIGERVNKKIPAATASYKLDAISGATSVGGSASNSSDGSAGGYDINAYVVFDFDMVANARILSAMHKSTKYSDEIISWWNSLNKLAAYMENGNDLLISYNFIKNNCGMEKGEDSYFTFAELYAEAKSDNSHSSIYKGRPYSVKNILEDAKLGETHSWTEATDKNAPIITIDETVKIGKNIILKYEENSNWEEKVNSIISNYQFGVTNTGFTVDKINNTITIPYSSYAEQLGAGKYTFKVYAEGFKASAVEIMLEKSNNSEFKLIKDKDGNIILSGGTEEFIKKVNGVILNGKGLLQQDNGGQYLIKGTHIILDKSLFLADSSRYVLKLTADGYGNEYITFTYNDIGQDIATIPVPSFIKLNESNTNKLGEKIDITVGSLLNGFDYAKAIISVSFNEENIMLGDLSFKDTITIPANMVKKVGENNILIKATGYEDKTFKVTIADQTKEVPTFVEIKGDSHIKGEDVKINIVNILDNSGYKEAIYKVTINEHIDAEYALKGNGELVLAGSNFMVADTYAIKISAVGFKDKELQILVKDIIPTKPDITPEQPEESAKVDAPNYVKLVDISGTTVSNPVANGNVYIILNDNIYLDNGYSSKSDISLYLEGNQIQGKANIKTISLINKDFQVFEIPVSSLTQGVNNLTIKAEGFNDKLFTIEKGDIAEESLL
ncbi:MAG: S-layer homology domain-containing protein [Aminipila sp.]